MTGRAAHLGSSGVDQGITEPGGLLSGEVHIYALSCRSHDLYGYSVKDPNLDRSSGGSPYSFTRIERVVQLLGPMAHAHGPWSSEQFDVALSFKSRRAQPCMYISPLEGIDSWGFFSAADSMCGRL